MELDDSFLKNDYDSDVIRTPTIGRSGFREFDRDDEISFKELAPGLEEGLSGSWDELKGIWPIDRTTSPLQEDALKELSKNVIMEKKKRRALQELLIEKDNEIKRLQEERKNLKGQAGSDSTPPSPNIVNPSSPFRDSANRLLEDDEETNLVEWVKTKTKLEQQIQQFKEELEKKDIRSQELEAECKRISLLNWRTTNDKLKQDVEMEVWRRKFLELQQQQAEKDELLKKREQETQYLRTELQHKNDENYKMALKLLDYKSKVSSVELQLRKWPVKKIHKLYPNVDVEIVLTKNPSNGVLSVDVLERGKHNLKPLKSVEVVQGADNRFNIVYKDGAVDTFESDNCLEIVDSMNEVLV